LPFSFDVYWMKCCSAFCVFFATRRNLWHLSNWSRQLLQTTAGRPSLADTWWWNETKQLMNVLINWSEQFFFSLVLLRWLIDGQRTNRYKLWLGGPQKLRKKHWGEKLGKIHTTMHQKWVIVCERNQKKQSVWFSTD
jgi:hypothetical protein